MFKKKSSKSDLEMEYQCTIRFLDDSEPIQLNFKKDSTGQWLLDQVCQRLNLIEKDYFGLRYVDMERQRHWLDPIKTVYKQLKELIVSAKKNDKVSHDSSSVNPMVLCFRVKFYPEDPMSLHEEITRYCLFLQLRRDLHHGRLLCPPSDANLLAAYIIQSELGDYDEQDHPPGYVSQFKMLPKQNLRMEEQIAEIHKTLQKQVPAEAEKNFLKKAASLDTYGIDPHHVKDQKGNPLFLGITHQGIMTFHGNRRTHLFTWSQMKRIVYEGKMFIVHVNTAEDINIEETELSDEEVPKKMTGSKYLCTGTDMKQQPIGYKCPTTSACKYLWRCAVEQQFFFTLSSSTNAPKVRSGGSLLTRGSRFRFSGRCQTEAIAASGGISRPEPAFTRSSSLPNFNHKRDSKVPLRNMSMTRDAAIKEELPVDVPGKVEQEEHISPDKMNTSKSAPIASSESSSEEKTLTQDVDALTGEASPVSVQEALQVPGDLQKSSTPGSESSDVVLAESLNMEPVPAMKMSLDEQIKELEQHWVQTQNSHFSPLSQVEASAVSNEKTAATTPTSSANAKAPSLLDRLYKCKPNMMYVSAVIALIIALVLIVVLASSIQHPIMALIRRQFNLEPMSDYINDKIQSSWFLPIFAPA
ncbi:FERM domain-containing protein 5 isoform X2 [Octopus sinensis]|uniref:FERM domain-containing protein 5 isoform X2 n=1 Tax=Octopus sinensis TaxID=2607531 RepID=A0A6P7T010_9MOLL|nr:FERM domain-containing protein 5 isoform X2 [Octopus sinensis]